MLIDKTVFIFHNIFDNKRVFREETIPKIEGKSSMKNKNKLLSSIKYSKLWAVL